MKEKQVITAPKNAQMFDLVKLILLALPITLICLFDIIRTLFTGRSKSFPKSNIYRHHKTPTNKTHSKPK
ncbi:hypothetical protein E2K93_00595 [Thalassotalea sp. HSM 43]|uniref:hypothetical protein n=1 Tax=Thalassotalea sp. HSM 43 TaxID=2552945 RepID=UPI001081B678|nr:hypothetical protein [Thalassotalea sp. HSM 43]QBY02959.1 hypothetical protein E2K93_00595 [Thalassotalea sp. HSM 43]